MHAAWRPAAVLVCVALATGGAADVALAGIASGRPAQFTASAGERNTLAVDRTSSGEVQFTDAGTPIVAGLFCLPVPLGQALCDPDGDLRDTDGGGVSVALGDSDDRAIIHAIPPSGGKGAPGGVVVLGGAGDDNLENAASAHIRFEGGPGDDTLVAGVAAAGVLIGGPGADVTASSALCCATSYEDHDGAVRVTLDGKPNDGAPDELDDVETHAVIGGPGADVITGDSGINALTGAAGADVLVGGGGDDTIDATVGAGTDGADTVRCGAGDDDVTAEANDKVAVDCEEVRVGQASGPVLVLDPAAARATRSGSVTVSYRVTSLTAVPPGGQPTGTVRLVDSRGRAASSTARYAIGAAATVARVRVKLSRATRRRLARSRAGRLALFAQRMYREGSSPAPGYALLNAPLTIHRAR
jgi:hypothetical protein